MPPLPTSVAEYAAPVVPCGSVAGANVIVAQSIVSEYASVPVQPLASVACAVKLDVPGVVGVPLIAPLVPSDNPAGSAPAIFVNEYGAVPPLAETVAKYAAPVVPCGSVVGATVIVAQSIVSEYASVPVQPFASVAWAVKFEVPGVVGVPVMAPLVASDKPAGNAPAIFVNE